MHNKEIYVIVHNIYIKVKEKLKSNKRSNLQYLVVYLHTHNNRKQEL